MRLNLTHNKLISFIFFIDWFFVRILVISTWLMNRWADFEFPYQSIGMFCCSAPSFVYSSLFSLWCWCCWWFVSFDLYHVAHYWEIRENKTFIRSIVSMFCSDGFRIKLNSIPLWWTQHTYTKTHKCTEATRWRRTADDSGGMGGVDGRWKVRTSAHLSAIDWIFFIASIYTISSHSLIVLDVFFFFCCAAIVGMNISNKWKIIMSSAVVV